MKFFFLFNHCINLIRKRSWPTGGPTEEKDETRRDPFTKQPASEFFDLGVNTKLIESNIEETWAISATMPMTSLSACLLRIARMSVCESEKTDFCVLVDERSLKSLLNCQSFRNQG